MSKFDYNNPKVGDRVFYNGEWCTVIGVKEGAIAITTGKQCKLSSGFDNVVLGLDPRLDVDRSKRRDKLEAIVDAVGEAFGVDTGTCSLDIYELAVDAADKALEEFDGK